MPYFTTVGGLQSPHQAADAGIENAYNDHGGYFIVVSNYGIRHTKYTLRSRIPYGVSRKLTSSQLFPKLTDREREILALIAQGLTNPAIAERFTLSPKTVRNHVSNIFSKLQVADQGQTILRAREAGL